MNNFYWPVYKNIEKELILLSNLIHIDDGQLNIYSTKIAELLLRTSVEIESISKTLYFQNGGEKLDDINLFFDTDCLDFLDNKFKLSKKQVHITASNFYFALPQNKILTPLNKANKRGSSSSDWKKAYQAVKHDRAASLSKANLKNLIRAMAALYLLNIYLNDDSYFLDKDSSGINFDRNVGSIIFSIKLHVSRSISMESDYSKNQDFDESVYLLRPTDETRSAMQQKIRELNDKTIERTRSNLIEELTKKLTDENLKNQENVAGKINELAKNITDKNFIQIAKENGQSLKNTLDGLRYEAVLNIHQY